MPLVSWDASWGSEYAYPEPYAGDAQYTAPTRFIELSVTDTSLAIAPNFSLAEVMSEDKGPYALFQIHAVESLQEIRDASGGPLTVNSAYRSVSYNEGVGGATYSRHMYGDGADLISSVYDLDELMDACEDAGADYTQLYEAHVHCDWREAPLDPSFYDVSSARSLSAARSPSPEHITAEIQVHGGLWTAPATGFEEGEPLRRWVARDADGAVLSRATGRSFVPPLGAAEVEVMVGARTRVHRAVEHSGAAWPGGGGYLGPVRP